MLLGSLVLSKRRTSNKVVCIHTATRSMLLYSHVIAVHLWDSVSTDSRQHPETVVHKSDRRETMPNGFQNCICLLSQTVQSKYLSGQADRKGKKDELVRRAAQQSEKGFDTHRDNSLHDAFVDEPTGHRSIRRLVVLSLYQALFPLLPPIQTRTLPLTSIRQIERNVLQIVVVQQVELALAAVVALIGVR